MFVAMSEVGHRSSEVKVSQVEQEVARGVGDPRTAPSMDTKDVEIAYKSTTGMVTYEPTKQYNGRHMLQSDPINMAVFLIVHFSSSKVH